jgi:hypothetical protein
MRLTALDGRYEPEISTNAPSTNDVVFLANRDRVIGKIEGVHDGKIKVLTRATHLEIPMERVVQLVLAKSEAEPVTHGPWMVRAKLIGGENLMLDIQQFQNGQLRGSNANFGSVELMTSSVRQLQFNLNRPTSGPNDLGLVSPESLSIEQ